jgi:excisionase family DNA binding protein
MPTTTPKRPGAKRRRAPCADAPQLASIDTAADFLDVHPRTVRRMVAAGQLRGYRITRLVKVDMRQVEQLATPVPPESVSA